MLRATAASLLLPLIAFNDSNDRTGIQGELYANLASINRVDTCVHDNQRFVISSEFDGMRVVAPYFRSRRVWLVTAGEARPIEVTEESDAVICGLTPSGELIVFGDGQPSLVGSHSYRYLNLPVHTYCDAVTQVQFVQTETYAAVGCTQYIEPIWKHSKYILDYSVYRFSDGATKEFTSRARPVMTPEVVLYQPVPDRVMRLDIATFSETQMSFSGAVVHVLENLALAGPDYDPLKSRTAQRNNPFGLRNLDTGDLDVDLGTHPGRRVFGTESVVSGGKLWAFTDRDRNNGNPHGLICLQTDGEYSRVTIDLADQVSGFIPTDRGVLIHATEYRDHPPGVREIDKRHYGRLYFADLRESGSIRVRDTGVRELGLSVYGSFNVGDTWWGLTYDDEVVRLNRNTGRE